MDTKETWMPEVLTDKSAKEIMKLRALMGLSPIKAGIRKCYRCGESFHTPDVARIRCCPGCKKYMQESNSSEYTVQGGVV
jgi:hypothetical protein